MNINENLDLDQDLKKLFKLAVKIYQRESRITDYGTNKLFLLLISFFAACKVSDIDVKGKYAIEEPNLDAIEKVFTVTMDDLDSDEITRGTLKELNPIFSKMIQIMSLTDHDNCDIYDFLYALYLQNPDEFKSSLRAFPDMETSWDFESSDAYHLIIHRSRGIMEKLVDTYDEDMKAFIRSMNVACHEGEITIDCMFEEELDEKKSKFPIVAMVDAMFYNPKYHDILTKDNLDEIEWQYMLEDYGIGDNDEAPSYYSDTLQEFLSNVLYLCDDINSVTVDDFIKAVYKKYPMDVKEVFEDILVTDTFYNTKLSRIMLLDRKVEEVKKQENKQEKQTSEDELIEYEEDMDTLKDYGVFLDEMSFSKNPAVGREKEIKKAMITLLTPEKSVMIVGEAGVGKTALVEGFAYRLKSGRVPKQLKGTKILRVTTSKLVEGCKYVGMFEERIEELFEVLTKYPNIILSIDEIHTAFGLGQGSHGGLDFANILKPYLDRGDVRVIATTTDYEYDSIVKDDEAFRRRFEKIVVKEPEEEIVFDILNHRVDELTNHYNMEFPYSFEDRKAILEEIIELTNRSHRVYNDNQNNPDLSLSIVSKAFAYAAYDSKDKIDAADFISAIEDCDRVYDNAKERSINRLKKYKNNSSPKDEPKVIKLEF